MIESIIASKKQEFEKVLEHFEHELNGLRTGRAHPALLSTVKVDVYGSLMPVEHVASVTVSDARTLTISPWDKSQMAAIEKGIQAANLGLNPSNDGSVIRLNLPPLTEDRRKEMVKLLGQMAEQTRIGIRKIREDILKAMKNSKEDHQISEDDLAIGQKKLQEIVDSYNEIIKKVVQEKEKDLMTV